MSPVLLATADHHQPGTGALFLVGVIALAVYAVGCWLWPFRACRKCGGSGRFRSPSGRAWRYCRKCSGRGAQLRTGRRIWNALKRTYDGGSRD